MSAPTVSQPTPITNPEYEPGGVLDRLELEFTDPQTPRAIGTEALGHFPSPNEVTDVGRTAIATERPSISETSNNGRHERVIPFPLLSEVGGLNQLLNAQEKSINRRDTVIQIPASLAQDSGWIPAIQKHDNLGRMWRINTTSHKQSAFKAHGAIRFRLDEANSQELIGTFQSGEHAAGTDRDTFFGFWGNVELEIRSPEDILSPTGDFKELIGAMINRTVAIQKERKEQKQEVDNWRASTPQLRMDEATQAAVIAAIKDGSELPRGDKDSEEAWLFWGNQFESLPVNTDDLLRKPSDEYQRLVTALTSKVKPDGTSCVEIPPEPMSNLASRLRQGETPWESGDPEGFWRLWGPQIDKVTLDSSDDIMTQPKGHYERLLTALANNPVAKDGTARLHVSEKAVADTVAKLQSGERPWPKNLEETKAFFRRWDTLTARFSSAEMPPKDIDWTDFVSQIRNRVGDDGDFDTAGIDQILTEALWAPVNIDIRNRFSNFYGVELEEMLAQQHAELQASGFPVHEVRMTNGNIDQSTHRPEFYNRLPGSAYERAQIEEDKSTSLVIHLSPAFEARLDALTAPRAPEWKRSTRNEAFRDFVTSRLTETGFDRVIIYVPNEQFYHPDRVPGSNIYALEQAIGPHNIEAAARTRANSNNKPVKPTEESVYLPGIPADKIIEVIIKNKDLPAELQAVGLAQERAVGEKLKNQHLATLLQAAATAKEALDSEQEQPQEVIQPEATSTDEVDPEIGTKEGKIFHLADYRRPVGSTTAEEKAKKKAA